MDPEEIVYIAQNDIMQSFLPHGVSNVQSW